MNSNTIDPNVKPPKAFNPTQMAQTVAQAFGQNDPNATGAPTPLAAKPPKKDDTIGYGAKITALMKALLEMIARFLKNLYSRITGRTEFVSEEELQRIEENRKNRQAGLVNQFVDPNAAVAPLATKNAASDMTAQDWEQLIDQGPDAIQAHLTQKLKDNPDLDLSDLQATMNTLMGEELSNSPQMQSMIQQTQDQVDLMRSVAQSEAPEAMAIKSFMPEQLEQMKNDFETQLKGNEQINLIKVAGVDEKAVVRGLMEPLLSNLEAEDFHAFMEDPKKIDEAIYSLVDTEAAYYKFDMQKGIAEIIQNSDPELDDLLVEVAAEEIINKMPNLERHSFLSPEVMAQVGCYLCENHQDTLSLQAVASSVLVDIATESPEMAMQVNEKKPVRHELDHMDDDYMDDNPVAPVIGGFVARG